MEMLNSHTLFEYQHESVSRGSRYLTGIFDDVWWLITSLNFKLTL